MPCSDYEQRCRRLVPVAQRQHPEIGAFASMTAIGHGRSRPALAMPLQCWGGTASRAEDAA
jgi:hypothetical protein